MVVLLLGTKKLQQVARHPFVCKPFWLGVSIVPTYSGRSVPVDLHDNPGAARVDTADAVARVQGVRTCDFSQTGKCFAANIKCRVGRRRERSVV